MPFLNRFWPRCDMQYANIAVKLSSKVDPVRTFYEREVLSAMDQSYP